jgi:hypothetical protein
MSAVLKPKTIPIRAVEPLPDEPPFITDAERFYPPVSGKYAHDESELRTMWSRIWRCFRNRRLCEGFLDRCQLHSMEIWAQAFEYVRQRKDPGFEIIAYIDAIAYGFEREGTPEQKAIKKAEMEEQARKAVGPQVIDPEDPDIKAFEKRYNTMTQETIAENPVFLRYKNRNRGVSE